MTLHLLKLEFPFANTDINKAGLKLAQGVL